MKAIIPAAGGGTRLLPHTYTIPKPLVHVAGKPMLGHILDDLEKAGIDSIGLVVGDRGERVTEYVKSSYKFKLDYVYQKERKGLGHAIYLYLSEKGFDDDPVLIVLSDTIFEADLTEILGSQYSSIAVHEVRDPRRFGIVELEGGFIKRLIEKPDVPTSNLAVVGIYLVNNVKLLFDCLQQIIDKDIRTRGEYQLTDALQLMLDSGEKITAFSVAGWHDCGTPETLLRTNRYLLKKASKGAVPAYAGIPGSIIISPVSISETAVIENSIIGPYVSIASGAKIARSIVEDTIVNENAIIQNALIKESLIGDNAIFDGQFSRLNVGDSSQIMFGR